MRDIRKSAHHEVHEDDDSESGSTSSASWSDDQPRHEDITIEINDDENMDSEPQQALEAMFNPRPYQIEMLEESMRRNIIVAVRFSAAAYYAGWSNTVADGYGHRQNTHSQRCFSL